MGQAVGASRAPQGRLQRRRSEKCETALCSYSVISGDAERSRKHVMAFPGKGLPKALWALSTLTDYLFSRGLTGHFIWLRHAHQGEHGRCQISQAAIP